MRLFHILFLLLAFSIAPLHATAQDAASSDVSVNTDNLSELIETLESETARQEFINNLKTLQDAARDAGEGDEAETGEPGLALNLDETAGSLIGAYDELLAGTGLSDKLVGQIGLTVLVLLIALGLMWAVKRLGCMLRDRLLRVRDKYHLRHNRFSLYAKGLRITGYLIIAAFGLYSIAVVWGLAEGDFTIGDVTRRFLVHTLTIVIITAIAVILWEVINTWIESYLQKVDGLNAARLRTIVPIARNVLMVAFVVLFTMVLLSEIGVNVVPLLAGAGVLGIAIGFGAQTMVKDFLTGFTILLEDLVQVGDVARVGDRIGLVEKITIRKVQLRDLAGIVYTVPFSEISIVENWTKDFSYYILDVGVAYREDTDEVIGYLKDIDEDMRADDAFKDLILEPLEILGVDKFADSAVIIKARIKTRPIQQWTVGREFNRRMKYKFDKHNVEIPFPHQTLYFGQGKDGKAPPAPVEVLQHAGGKTKAVAGK